MHAAALGEGTLPRAPALPPGPLSTLNRGGLAQWLGADRPIAAAEIDSQESLEAEPAERFIPPNTTHYQYDMINDPGPLAKAGGGRVPPAANFSAGKYNETVLTKPTVLFRAQPKALLKIGGDGQYDWDPKTRIGRWFSPEPPASAAVARIDAALPDHWIDPHDAAYLGSSMAESVLAVRLPAGVKVYYGPTSAQGGVLVGGMHKIQVYVPDVAAIPGVRVLSEEPLGAATMQGVVETLRRHQ
jgi:hypothetical protein